MYPIGTKYRNTLEKHKIDVYRGLICVQSTEIEDKFRAIIQKNMQIGNKRIITIKTQRNVLHSVVYIVQMQSEHTQVKCFVLSFGLRGEGRRDWEGIK